MILLIFRKNCLLMNNFNLIYNKQLDSNSICKDCFYQVWIKLKDEH